MKRTVVVTFLLILLWLITTGVASALSDCLKGPILARSGVIRTTACDMDRCGNCGKCGSCANATSATYIYSIEEDGLWLTSQHAIKDADQVTVNYHPAEIYTTGETAGYGWVVLMTSGYIPCGASDVTPYYGNICCGMGLIHVNIGKCGDKCGDIRKLIVTDPGGDVLRTNLLPGCWNCGAGAYDLCGRLVGVLVAGGQEGCKCSKTKYEEFIRVDDRMFTQRE